MGWLTQHRTGKFNKKITQEETPIWEKGAEDFKTLLSAIPRIPIDLYNAQVGYRKKNPVGSKGTFDDIMSHPITGGMIKSFLKTIERSGSTIGAVSPVGAYLVYKGAQEGDPLKYTKSTIEDYKKHPVLSGVEDISNVTIALAPALKAAGAPTLGTEVAKYLNLPESESLTGSVLKQGFKTAAEKVPQLGTTYEKFNISQGVKDLLSIAQQTQSTRFNKEVVRNPLMQKISQLSKGDRDLLNLRIKGTVGGVPEHIENIFKEYKVEVAAGGEALKKRLLESPVSELTKITKGYRGEYKQQIADTLKSLRQEERGITKGKSLPGAVGHLKETKAWVVDKILEGAPYQQLESMTGRTAYQLKQMGVEPEYFQHFFTEYNPLKETKLINKVSGVGKKTPSFAKGRSGMPGYIEDPAIYVPLHKKVQITHEILNDLVDDLGKNIGKTKPKGIKQDIINGTKGFMDENGVRYVQYSRKLTDDLGIKSNRVIRQNLYIPEVAVKHLKSMIDTPGHLEKALDIALPKGATNLWRMSVLSLSPRWVFNNFFGNLMMNSLTGGGSIKGYAKSAQQLWREHKGKQGLFLDDATRAAIETGAPYHTELANALQNPGRLRLAAREQLGKTAVGEGVLKTSEILSKVPKGMTKVNEVIEDWARTAHYITKTEKGMTPKAALESMNKALFNYNKLSPFEQNVMRRVFPFWTWTRNITKFAATYPMDQPVRMAIFNKLAEVSDLAKQSEQPDYMRDQVELPFKDKNGKPMFVSTRGINPLADISLFENITKPGTAVSKMHPGIKNLYELMSGLNSLSGKEFTSPYEKVDAQGEPIRQTPSPLELALRNFPQYTTAKEMIRPYAKYDTGEPMLDKKGKPISTKMRELELLKLFGINIKPRDIKEIEKNMEERRKRAATSKANYERKLQRFKNSYKG